MQLEILLMSKGIFLAYPLYMPINKPIVCAVIMKGRNITYNTPPYEVFHIIGIYRYVTH